MWRRIGKFAHVGLTVLSVGACGYLLWVDRDRHRASTHGDPIDYQFRQFAEVRWIGGEYELPPGQGYYALTELQFENGSFARRGTSTTLPAPTDEPALVMCSVLWGPGPSGPKRVATMAGLSMSSGADPDTFFAHLDGPLLRMPSGDTGEINGCRIFGYAVSNELCDGFDEHSANGLQLDNLVKRHRYVLMLGYKGFDTREAANNWVCSNTSKSWPNE